MTKTWNDLDSDIQELDCIPRFRTLTRDGHEVCQFDAKRTWEVRVYDKYGTRVGRDTAMDETSSNRWYLGAVQQYGGAYEGRARK